MMHNEDGSLVWWLGVVASKMAHVLVAGNVFHGFNNQFFHQE
jgi:hypothetical protein